MLLQLTLSKKQVLYQVQYPNKTWDESMYWRHKLIGDAPTLPLQILVTTGKLEKPVGNVKLYI